jgi:hypothetical protein
MIRTGQEGSKELTGVIALMALCAAAAPWLVASVLPPMAQPQSYHDFADQRTLWGIPHALNVLSNLPFVVVGLMGLQALATRVRFLSPLRGARAPWIVLFIGVALTGLGSAYYHLDPSDATLVWDRLPMALGFAGLVAGTLADRAVRLAWLLLAVLVGVGTGAVIYWAVLGNLVPYLVMQASFIAIALVATVMIRSPYSHAGVLYAAVALYAAAIVSERLDHPINAALGGVVSGHTLKHLFAAAGGYAIYRMLVVRQSAAAGQSR